MIKLEIEQAFVRAFSQFFHWLLPFLPPPPSLFPSRSLPPSPSHSPACRPVIHPNWFQTPVCAAGLHPPPNIITNHSSPVTSPRLSSNSEIAWWHLILGRGGYYSKCLGNSDLCPSWINADIVQHDIPSLGKTISDIECLAFISSVREWPHFHFCLHQNQLMAQHGLAAALLPASVTELLTVTRLLAVRIPVHREQKEPDIVALSWCSEASNISQRELHLHLRMCVPTRIR